MESFCVAKIVSLYISRAHFRTESEFKLRYGADQMMLNPA